MKDINIKDYEVGAIVGRFQLAEPHIAHKLLADTAVKNHKKTIILLGVPQAIGTPEDPIRLASRENSLDFTSRCYMLQQLYPNTVIVPIQDTDDDYIWSETLDLKIREIFPTEKVLLYGGRDSFAPHYHGLFDIKTIDPEIYISATMERHNTSKEVLSSVDFRKGQIYQAYQQTLSLYTRYKIAVKDNNEILFMKKCSVGKKQYKYQLLYGLAGINDISIEAGSKRVIGNLIGIIESTIKYEMSKTNIDYGNKTNRIMDVLVTADKTYGNINPKGNFDLKWIPLESLTNDYIQDNIEDKDVEYIKYLKK